MSSPPPHEPSSAKPVKYVHQQVKVVRGREDRKIAELASAGWELVSQERGAVRTELTFRKAQSVSLLSRPFAAFQALAPDARRRLSIALGGLAVLVLIIAAVAMSGGDDKPGPEATPKSSEPVEDSSSKEPGPPAGRKAVEISVDDLYDKLNATDTKVGDRFRITGVLSGSEYWGVGASGDFSVLVEAKGGTNDLMIFIDEKRAEGWGDGTMVEFVVEDTEVTIDGETSGGWLRAISAKEL